MAAQNIDDYFPFDAGDGAAATEVRWRLMFRYMRTSGVIPITETGLAGQYTVTQSGGDVRIGAGVAIIRGHIGQSITNHDHTPAAADPTNPRIDRAILRLDTSANTIATDLLEGTPAASPSPPALTDSSDVLEIRLAQIRVAAQTGSLTVTDERQWSTSATDDPIGALVPYSAVQAAVDRRWQYLPADGRAVSRVTYQDLFAIAGTAFGAGDGATTFNLPDLRGRAPFGLDNLGGSDAGRLSLANTLGLAGGEQTHILTLAEIAAHTHGPGTLGGTSGGASANHTHAAGEGTGFVVGAPASTVGLVTSPTNRAAISALPTAGISITHVHNLTLSAGASASSGSGTAHNNMPPYILTGWLVKLF